MIESAKKSRKRSWHLPLLLSFLAHGLLAGLVAVAPIPQDSFSIAVLDAGDTEESEFESNVMDIYDPPARVRERVSAVSSGPISAPPVVAAAEAPGLPIAAETEAPSSFGQETSPAAAPASAPTPLFPVPATARSVVYVIDRSGSMGSQGRLDLARRELRASLERLGDGVRFQVIAYNRRAEPLRLAGSTGLTPANTATILQAEAALASLIPEGGTEHLQALKQALLLNAEVIYFLTDADDLKPADVATLTRLNGGHTALHVIELTLANRDRHDLPMHRLAAENRGTYRAVEP